MKADFRGRRQNFQGEKFKNENLREKLLTAGFCRGDESTRAEGSESGLEENLRWGYSPPGLLILTDTKQVLILPKYSSLKAFITELLCCVSFQGPLNVDVAPGAPQEKNGVHRKSDADEMREQQR